MIVDNEVMADRVAAWEAINALIKVGPLPGNGCDETAQRNGLILAANILAARIEQKKAREVEHSSLTDDRGYDI